MLSVREIFPLSKLGLWESNNLKKKRTVWHPAVTAAFRFCTHMNLSSVLEHTYELSLRSHQHLTFILNPSC